MSATIGLADKIERIHRALTRARLPHAFGGALALAYYATPRATIDIDLNVFIPPDKYLDVLKILRRLGVDRFPDSEVVSRDGQARTWWGSNPVDLFFSYDPIHDAMKEASRVVPFGATTIPIIAPEHLMVAKVVFNRSKDWVDIEQMLVAVPDLDLAEVQRWLTHLIGDGDARFERFIALRDELRLSE